MSKQGSSNQVSLQSDIGNIPGNAVSLLGALSPFIQAASADNVSPLAVVQVEALGACFHLNGDLAGKIPDLLRRNISYRLERLSLSIGWRGNDTASHMAKTAGGRAASILSLAIMELYNEETGGDLLYQLSQKLLPADASQSSRTQLGRVSGILSKKLAAFGFGNHLAVHVTRIREAYFNSGIEVPQNLLAFPTVETIAEFLHCLSRALMEEQSMLYFQGCRGVGHLLAIVMALCPDDVLVTVENEVIFQGERRSVIFDIQSSSKTQFSIESILYTSGKRLKSPQNVLVDKRELFKSSINLKWEGCLSDALELALAGIGAHFTMPIRIACVELICAIIFSLPWKWSGREGWSPLSLPSDGFARLLGQDGRSRVRDTLGRIFLCEPSFTILQCDKAYTDLCISLANTIPSTSCKCGKCFADGRFTDVWMYRPMYHKPTCKVVEVWIAIDWIISQGVFATFVSPGENTSIRMSIQGRSCNRGCLLSDIRSVLAPIPRDRPLPAFRHVGYYLVSDLHLAIINLLANVKVTTKAIGSSSGACSIFPATIQNPVFESPLRLEYFLVDGQFRDEHNSYQILTSDPAPARRPVLIPNSEYPPITQSSSGVHTNLTLSTRAIRDQLIIRTMVQISTKTLKLDFYNQHLAYMSVNIATRCDHDTGKPLGQSTSLQVTPTSVLAPVACTERTTDISVALTHKNPEAQFLACNYGTRTLFQGDSCLNCAVKEALELRSESIIQS